MKDFWLKTAIRVLRMPNWLLWKLQRYDLMRRFRAVGKNLVLDRSCSIVTPETISLGNNVFVAELGHFGGDITIGDNVLFGPRVTIISNNHVYGILGKSPRFILDVDSKTVKIESEVWIGSNVTILGGNVVGTGAVIGAGSVVVSDVPPFSVSVGNPSIPVRRIFDDQRLMEHLKLLGYSEPEAHKILERRIDAVGNKKLPVIDKSDVFKEISYVAF